MNISLTLDQMLSVFEAYNTATLPVQVIAGVIIIIAVILTIKPVRSSGNIILAVLSLIWLWTGVVFCIIYWAKVFTPSYAYAALYIIQGILFFTCIFSSKLSFRFKPDIYSFLGILFILYSIAGYPLIGYLIGHNYPQSVSLILAPCPTVVLTFGFLLLTDKKFPKYILIIPLLWSLCGIMPVMMGILEDIGLITAGVVGTVLIFVREKIYKY
jgi:hypothetical protein